MPNTTIKTFALGLVLTLGLPTMAASSDSDTSGGFQSPYTCRELCDQYCIDADETIANAVCQDVGQCRATTQFYQKLKLPDQKTTPKLITYTWVLSDAFRAQCFSNE